MDTTELQNQAIEIRDAENEGENTALRVGTMLLAIIDAFANIVDLDTLQQILEQYAGVTSGGQIYWRHARCVFLASMGAELDAVNGDGWEYTDHNGDIVFNPTSRNLRVVGETGSYFVATNVLYVHAHTCHTYKWDAAERKMVEITDTNLPTVITYKNTPAFSQVAIGESYVFQSQSSGPKIAIKISSSETYSFLPDPKKIYAFRDIRQAMLWQPSNQTWVSLTPRVINDLTTGGEGDALSAEMGKTLMVTIQQTLGALGNYAFPGGKPTIDWGGSSSVTYTVTYPTDSKVTHSGAGDTVELGSSLEVTLGIASGNDLYVINDSSVKVYMSGIEQSGAYDATTQKVTLAAVTGNVVIVAEAWTYVQGAVVLLDGHNIGSNTNQWANLANDQKPLVLSGGYTKNSNNVAFDGVDGTGIIDGLGIDLQDDASTAEIVMSLNALPPSGYFLTSGYNHNTILAVVKSGSRYLLTSQTVQYGGNISTGAQAAYLDSGENQFLFAANQIISLSRQGRSFTLNNASLTTTTTTVYAIVGGPNMSAENTYDASGKLFISGVIARKGQYLYPMKGKMYCVRIYNRVLTTQERTQNYNIDKKRFNLA